ncbi:UxaA family hydrolase [Alicyclobacillus dauci]|uniref:UxaA family hydrolase n=1 Tax=Alicyclobacillus dauci TaxID=1475485 RepID=A0ABY6YYP2_9BACL|nr:UxaA family hydrolase [Alicyclobacillus dauci]WAH35241.1 UxaA family hydrolase [Alicyclobacillus dauci]
MSNVRVFRRNDGSVGIRNHLFILPAVVCANQVAIDVARRNPKFKYIEHQHGCAQIGADLIQTQRVFSNLAIHPNAYASLFVGLGCEGIIAKNLYEDTKARTEKPLGFVSIQGSGGTLKAQSKVEMWLADREDEVPHVPQTEVDWGEIRIGLLMDQPFLENESRQVHRVIDSLLETGVSLVLSSDAERYVPHSFAHVNHIDHGDIARDQLSLMRAGSNGLETATGLTASGAHLIVHLASEPHAFGTPLLPVVRFSLSEASFGACPDDFDGRLLTDADVFDLINETREVIEGKPAVAESLGMDDFALYRIGPTV